MLRRKATKTVHLLKLAYPIGTVNKPPFQNQILTERVLHVAHSNTFRVIGGKFQIPTHTSSSNADSDGFDISSSIDHLLHENQPKKMDEMKKLREIDWESSDAFGRIVKKTDMTEKRKYLRKLFASTNNQLSSVIITKLSVSKDLNVEDYFENPNLTDYAYEVSTDKITELRHVDLEELEFNPDDGTFEVRMVAATARVLEEKKQATKSKQRRNFILGILMVLGFLSLIEYTSEKLGEKTARSTLEREENGEESVSGEDISANILNFAKSQGRDREKTYLEEKMNNFNFKSISRLKKE